MRLKQFDFEQLNENAALNLLSKLTCNDINKTKALDRNVLYYCRENNSDTVHCVVYLGKIHGEYDMCCYTQYISLIAGKQSYKAETIYLDETKWVFDLKYDYNIVIDSSNTLIELGIHSKTADNAVSVCHYTSIANAVKILKQGGFWAKTLNCYATEEKFNDSVQQKRCAFFISFCGNMIDDRQMWRTFLSKYGKERCKLEFYFKNGLKDAFMPSKPLKCYADTGCIGLLEPKSLRFVQYSGKERVMPRVYAEISYQHVNYEDKEENNSNIFLTDENAYNIVLNRIGYSVQKRFSYQNEIRVNLLLWSLYKEELLPFDKIFVPYDINKIEKINIKVGNDTTAFGIKKINKVIDNEKVFFGGYEV